MIISVSDITYTNSGLFNGKDKRGRFVFQARTFRLPMPRLRLTVVSRPGIAVETSIPSYLTARRSRDLIATANQELTQEWWGTRRDDFYLVISEFVLREASAGDPIAASNRLAAIAGIPELNVTDEVGLLARTLIEQIPIPEKAQLDAFHIAVATVHGIDY